MDYSSGRQPFRFGGNLKYILISHCISYNIVNCLTRNNLTYSSPSQCLLPSRITLSGLLPFRINFEVMNLKSVALLGRDQQTDTMPRVRFEPTIPVVEWPKTFHALDLVATVTDNQIFLSNILESDIPIGYLSCIISFPSHWIETASVA
jgi:hypothetical protein